MSDIKQSKSADALPPCIRYTPAQAVCNKKARDERRKAIRHQNARTTSL